MKAGDATVLLSLSVREKRRYAEMKGEMGCEHVGGKKRLLISRLRQKY